MLATPEIAGLPYVISGLVAAGGLAAALSTADGLLLTIANALSHDLYYKMIDPNASTARRVTVSKVPAAGGGADRRLRDLAQAGRHPVPGRRGVLAGGLGVLPGAGAGRVLEARQQVGRDRRHGRRAGHLHVLHVQHLPVLRRRGVPNQWFDMSPISAGMFGMPVGILTIIVVSLLTPRAVEGSAGTGRPRALPEPGGRHQHRRAPDRRRRSRQRTRPAQAGLVILAAWRSTLHVTR